MHLINPDHYLQTAQGRVWTAERGKQAWEWAYADLEKALSCISAKGIFYLVCGIQGAGKTTWVQTHAAWLDEHAVVLDAALPAKRHRVRALNLAAQYAVPAVAVWLDVPLALALQRNAQRAEDEQVPIATIQQVHSLFEPPSLEEGFWRVLEV